MLSGVVKSLFSAGRAFSAHEDTAQENLEWPVQKAYPIPVLRSISIRGMDTHAGGFYK
jgi:hypothetical protein